MAKRSLSGQLDQWIAALLAQPDVPLPTDIDPGVAPLVALAKDLCELPRAGFKQRLKSELGRKSSMSTATEIVSSIRQTATPVLRITNCGAAIEFYKKAFGAEELFRFETGGKIPHAEIRIGNSVIMVAESAPDYGSPAPDTFGGTPVIMHLYVEDVDAMVERAVAAGARILRKVDDHFYGDRGGQVEDPFGHRWSIATRKEDLSLEEMHRRMEAAMAQQAASRTAPSYIPKGFRALTPYIVAEDVPKLLDFVTRVFGADEKMRTVGSGGGYHAEVRIGDSMLMMGGAGEGVAWRGEPRPVALHTYVKDVDAAYERALAAGASALTEPQDHPYGERGASVKDSAGNYWYIATAFGDSYKPAGLPDVIPSVHPARAEPMIAFLKRAFGAEEKEKHALPTGEIVHAKIDIAGSILEMGEAHGPYQPMHSMFYLYVPDVDAMYHRALAAGATAITEPADQPYGDRNAGVKDVFGHEWYVATHIKDIG